MTEEKLSRIIVGCVVGGIAFLVVFFAFPVYQWIKIGVQNRRIEKLEAEIVELEEIQEQLLDDQRYFESDYYKWLEAVQRYDLQGK